MEDVSCDHGRVAWTPVDSDLHARVLAAATAMVGDDQVAAEVDFAGLVSGPFSAHSLIGALFVLVSDVLTVAGDRLGERPETILQEVALLRAAQSG